jgi:hypothetical protein
MIRYNYPFIKCFNININSKLDIIRIYTVNIFININIFDYSYIRAEAFFGGMIILAR